MPPQYPRQHTGGPGGPESGNCDAATYGRELPPVLASREARLRVACESGDVFSGAPAA